MLNPKDIPSDPAPGISTDGAVGVAKTPKWHIGFVAPRTEKIIRERLLARGVEAYVASRNEVHVWRRNERRVVEQVIITCVVFIHTTEDKLEGLRNTYKITSFMRDHARKQENGWMPYAFITDEEMSLLQAMLRQDEYDVAFSASDFTIGEYVRVIGFDSGDQLAQIVRLPGDKKSYVGIRVDFLGCAYMKVPATRILKVK